MKMKKTGIMLLVLLCLTACQFINPNNKAESKKGEQQNPNSSIETKGENKPVESMKEDDQKEESRKRENRKNEKQNEERQAEKSEAENSGMTGAEQKDRTFREELKKIR